MNSSCSSRSTIGFDFWTDRMDTAHKDRSKLFLEIRTRGIATMLSEEIWTSSEKILWDVEHRDLLGGFLSGVLWELLEVRMVVALSLGSLSALIEPCSTVPSTLSLCCRPKICAGGTTLSVNFSSRRLQGSGSLHEIVQDSSNMVE
ncbi:hypothetical protein Tco_0058306 [Tanacetum coccineum]